MTDRWKPKSMMSWITDDVISQKTTRKPSNQTSYDMSRRFCSCIYNMFWLKCSLAMLCNLLLQYTLPTNITGNRCWALECLFLGQCATMWPQLTSHGQYTRVFPGLEVYILGQRVRPLAELCHMTDRWKPKSMMSQMMSIDKSQSRWCHGSQMISSVKKLLGTGVEH